MELDEERNYTAESLGLCNRYLYGQLWYYNVSLFLLKLCTSRYDMWTRYHWRRNDRIAKQFKNLNAKINLMWTTDGRTDGRHQSISRNSFAIWPIMSAKTTASTWTSWMNVQYVLSKVWHVNHFKDIPKCFLHVPLCWRVQIISNRYVMMWISISNNHIYCMRDIYYTCEPPKLKSK